MSATEARSDCGLGQAAAVAQHGRQQHQRTRARPLRPVPHVEFAAAFHAKRVASGDLQEQDRLRDPGRDPHRPGVVA